MSITLSRSGERSLFKDGGKGAAAVAQRQYESCAAVQRQRKKRWCIESYSVFVLALALTKDVECRGSATKLERGCSSFIVFWETGLHSTRTDEDTTAETWLCWAGVMQWMRMHCAYWARWIASVVAERALDRSRDPTSTPRRRLDLCRGTGGVGAALVQSGGSTGKREVYIRSISYTHS
ncbi:hypothetical protein B0H14DRAFT_2611448 [Mycena olivaceomarginata]|nr:hypothetical protein B0H14DRAFT_2611448 [Mycena olivaceomarginata]